MKDAQKTAQERLIEVGRAVNWPAEFQNLGEFLFNFMVQTMVGQAIPPIRLLQLRAKGYYVFNFTVTCVHHQLIRYRGL